MRAATASRAVSISTGTAIPAARHSRASSSPVLPGSVTSSTTAS